MDKARYASKLDNIDTLLQELQSVLPPRFAQYEPVPVRRSCERIVQVLIETMLDVCSMLQRDLKLGLSGTEEEMLEKLRRAEVFSSPLMKKLFLMKGFRNLLVHRYADVDDQLVFRNLHRNITDFREFQKEVRSIVGKK